MMVIGWFYFFLVNDNRFLIFSPFGYKEVRDHGFTILIEFIVDWNKKISIFLFSNKIIWLNIKGKIVFFIWFICYYHIDQGQISPLTF